MVLRKQLWKAEGNTAAGSWQEGGRWITASGPGCSACHQQGISGGRGPWGMTPQARTSFPQPTPPRFLTSSIGARERTSSRPCPQPSPQALMKEKLKGTPKLSNTTPHSTEGGAEALRGNSAAPGHIVRFKPRTLSTSQTVSSCSPGLEITQQIKVLVLPASGKDRSVHGQTLCS